LGGLRKPVTIKKPSTVLTGVAGEYFVAAELSRRGHVASLTLRNTRGIDVLASNQDATKSVGIQVKTCWGSRPEWILNKKAEADLADNLFYVFVCLPETGSPTFHVVPRSAVAKHVRERHQEWLSTPGRGGREHVDNDMRKFEDADGRYRDRWDLLCLD
jgi:hypothetical protein